MSKGLWTLLLIFSTGLALVYGAVAGSALWKYLKFSAEVPAKVSGWEAVPKGSRWALKSSYTYRLANKSFAGSALLPQPYYFNLNSAEKEAKAFEQMEWTVWVDPYHPECSVWEKGFPLKKVVYALCLLGVCLYFVYLKFHVELLSSRL